MRVVRERTVRIKDIWDIPEAAKYEKGAEATLISSREVILGAIIVRPAEPFESDEPSPDPKHQEAADRGYWSRLMKAWRSR